MPTRLGRDSRGKFRRVHYCESCQMIGINGRATHETGCPDAWLDSKVECKFCGYVFKPKQKGVVYRSASCADIPDSEFNEL